VNLILHIGPQLKQIEMWVPGGKIYSRVHKMYQKDTNLFRLGRLEFFKRILVFLTG
jgi:hypothetical protein